MNMIPSNRILAVGIASLLAVSATGFAQSTWVGDVNQDWNNAANWSTDPNPPTGNFFINTAAAGVYPILSANSAFTPVDIFVGQAGNTGRWDHTAGTAANGTGNWMFVGQGNAGVGTYNLANTAGTGGVFTGFAQGSGSMNVGGTGAGRLILGDGGTSTGTLNMNTSGTLTATNAPIGLLVGTNIGDGVVNLDNGTINTSVAWFGDNNAASNGALNMSGGAFNATGNIIFAQGGGTASGDIRGGTITQTGGEFRVGASGTATISQSGGTVTNATFFVIGRDAGSSGTYNLSGGTVNAATTGGFTSVGSGGGSTGVLDVSGTGVYNSTNGGMIVGEGWNGTTAATGTVNISGGGLVNTGLQGVHLGAQALGNGTVNLNGGTLQTNSISNGGGTGTFNFNGGTLRANGDNATYMQGVTTANVQAGGAIIDSNGFNVTVAQALLQGSGSTGGLTKVGAGTLTLSGANTYAGATTVTGGTLSLTSTGTLGAGNVNLNDTAGVVLTLQNTASLNDASVLNFGALSDINLDFLGVDALASIVQTNDSQSIGAGTYSAGQLNAHFQVDSFSGTGQLTVLVPEPSAFVTLLGGVGLLGLRRRRS